MVGVAQLVRASGCGPEGRGFDPHRSPNNKLLVINITSSFHISLDNWPHRLMVRTSPFHGGNRGSNPLGVTKPFRLFFNLEGFFLVKFV